MFKLLKNLNKKEFGIISVMSLLIIGQVWLELKMPDYMSEITTLVSTEGSAMSDVLVQGGYMLLCALGSLVLMAIVGFLSSFTSASLSKKIRKRIFDKVEEFGMEEMNKFSVSSLITRTTNDITQVQMFISMGMQLLIKSPIMAVWAILKILNKGIEWSVATGVAVLVLLVIISILMITVLPKFKKVQKMIDDVNNVTRENLKGIRIVRAFNAEEYQENKFENKNTSLTKLQMFNQRMMSILSPVMYLVMYFLTLSIYLIGAKLIDGAQLMDKIDIFSNMVVFSSYAMQVIMSFIMLAMIFIMYPRASVSAKRINEVIDTEPNIKNGTVKTTLKDKVGEVEFKNVSFKYPDGQNVVLKDISFKAKKGSITAIIGSTGSGKSSLINLIPRFYDATSGEVLVDGINVKDYDLEILHNKIGYVPQKAVMFSDSVYNNVDYGENGKPKKSEVTVKKAIEIAQAKDFVEAMPNGYDDDVSQGGTNISGGQKQRIAIARAIARDPEIYIFDDSFSALDYKTDYKLRKELKKNFKDTTMIIVAQRIGTVIDADQIIVLEDGKCAGIGTHKELLKNCDVYREIAYSQLSKEELENAR